MFGDGSREAYATLAYVRWVLDDGSVECKLIAGKSRVAPKQKISIPRMELMGALLSARLARKIRDSFTFKFKGTRYFTDSSAILGMLRCDSASFLEFVGTRVSQVKALSSPEKEWFWIPTDCNLADLGTRPNVEPGDLQEGSDYQEGMAWMRLPEAEWPARQHFSPPPQEERRKDVVTVAVAFHATAPGLKFGSLKKLINTYAYVLQAIRKWRMYRRGEMSETQCLRPPEPDAVEAAELYLIEEAQRYVDVKKIQPMLTEIFVMTDKLGFERRIILVGGRVKAKYRIGYDRDGIPVLPSKCSLSDLYMLRAHEVDHGGINTMVMRTRSSVWIMQGAKVACKIKNRCYRCRLLWKPLQQQEMASMPDFRLGPQPVFSTMAVDLFGPLEYKDMVKKRVTGKGWGVILYLIQPGAGFRIQRLHRKILYNMPRGKKKIFVCTASSAIHLELTESYSTDAFLQALRRFMCLHGTPHTIISDRGDQLVAASRQVEDWDPSAIQDWLADRKIKWKFAPTGGQHMNGQAERMIRQVKNVLKSTLEGKSCSFNELTTILFEAAIIVNSRPIRIAGREAGTPITPLHLMLGRATIEAPQMDFNTNFNLTRRLKFVDEVKKEFLHKWRAIVFQGLDRSYKWRQGQRDSQVGDVVLLKDETAAGNTSKLARVVEVFWNLQDGRVRQVTVAYKNFKEKGFRTSTRPIHKIVLIVPAEDANLPPLPAPGDPPVDLPALLAHQGTW
jgi:hypothetical protein